MNNQRIGAMVIRHPSLPSTMDEAARLAASGAPEGTVVVAGEQTAGRGRAGRDWHAPAGSASLSSFILRPKADPARWPLLALIAGVAVAETIEISTGRHAWLKWPNDVWLGSRVSGEKVAGVLLTSRVGTVGGGVIAGIGVNVSATRPELPPGATSLHTATGRTFAVATVETTLWRQLDRAYAAFEQTNGYPDLTAWRRRAALIGERVTISDHARTIGGVLLGIDDDGRLRLRDRAGIPVTVTAGELTRGPRLTLARR